MSESSIVMRETRPNSYTSVEGFTVRREFGLTQNDNRMDGRWVLRDNDGIIIDFCSYLNDIAVRNDLDFYIQRGY